MNCIDRIQPTLVTRMLALPVGSSQFTVSFWEQAELPALRSIHSENFILMFVLSGRGEYHQDGSGFALEPGSFVQRFPQKPHRIHREAGERWLEFAIHMSRSLFDYLHGLGVISDCVHLHPGLDQELIDRLQHLLDLAQATPEWQPQGFLVELQRFFVDMTARETASTRDLDQVRRIEHACRLLSSAFSRSLTMPAVAGEIGMGYHSFRKAFSQLIGMSPKEYRVHRRIDHAKRLLLQGQRLDPIAVELGYTDAAALSRQFKQVTGLTPSQFRRSW